MTLVTITLSVNFGGDHVTAFCNCKWFALSENEVGQFWVDGGVTSEITREKEEGNVDQSRLSIIAFA